MKILQKLRTRLCATSSRLAAFLLAASAASGAWAATPLAVWDGNFDKTSINGVTFNANGNTVAADGSYGEIGSSSAVGVEFKSSTSYKYFQVVFTVSDLDEDATGNRALAVIYLDDTAKGGVYLKTGAIDVSGVCLGRSR